MAKIGIILAEEEFRRKEQLKICPREIYYESAS
jgi:hypothetical protein